MLSLSLFNGWRSSPARVEGDRLVMSGDSVSGVARRHGLSPQQLFGWRRQVRESQAALSKADGSQFVPAVVDAPPSTPSARRQRKVRRDEAEVGAGTIEIEIDGVTVRIGRDGC